MNTRVRSFFAGTGIVIGALVVVGMIASCGTARRGEAIGRPIVQSTPVLERGSVLFDRHCDHCHPGGAAGLGPGIHDKPLPEFLIRMQVRNGFGEMPAFDETDLPEADLDAIIAYLAAARGADKIE
jgi:mono/diheme cytochrome c family protein